MGEDLEATVIERHAKRLIGHARRVTNNLDPTDDTTHGAQQLSFSNSHYDNACYLLVMGFASFNDEADQYLRAAVLRPGNVTATAGARCPRQSPIGKSDSARTDASVPATKFSGQSNIARRSRSHTANR